MFIQSFIHSFTAQRPDVITGTVVQLRMQPLAQLTDSDLSHTDTAWRSSTTATGNQSDNQSINQSLSQSINQSINHSVSQSDVNGRRSVTDPRGVCVSVGVKESSEGELEECVSGPTALGCTG